MKITLELIRDHIQEYEGIISCSSGDWFRGWYQAAIYSPKSEYEEEFLLFGYGEEFPDLTEGRGLVCVGKPSGQILSQNDVLYFPKADSLGEVYLAIQRVFLKFGKWEGRIQEEFQKNPSLENMFQLTSDLLENSMFIHDENFYLLTSVNEMPGQMKWEYDSVQGAYVLPLDILNDFKVNQDYLDTMTTVGPSMFPSDTFGYRILYQNLWHNGQYRGRICVNELKRTIYPSDYYLLDVFSQMVLESFQLGEIAGYKQNFSLSKFLVRLIENEAIDTKTLNGVLMQYGWTAKDEYFCACLFPEERDIHTNSVQYFCTRISDELPYTCAFIYENAIVILVNSTLSDLTIPNFRNEIGVMQRESLMKAGISSVCSDLSQFYYMYRQAICALETGRKKQEAFWSYCFDDYQMDYILRNALQEFPAEMLCCKEIFWLREYDVDHISELSKTLKIYLENDRNLARTAEILDIHRSTLLYRIGRIKDITRLDMEESKVRFRLWLSYYLLAESGGQL